MSPWTTILCFVFLSCLLGHSEGRARIVLQGKRTHAVLAGHDVHLYFIVGVPHNTSAATLECYHGDRHVTPLYTVFPPSEPGGHFEMMEVVLHFNHSSESGEYHCIYVHPTNVKYIYLAIRVRDEGFTETYHGLKDEVVAPVAAVTVFFLIFSVLGTIYICKSQAAEDGQDDDNDGVVSVARRSTGGQRGDLVEQEGEDEEAGANSVYTTLESRPASIYDVLDPSVSSSRTQSKKSSRRRSKKKEEAAAADDGIFESVYENV